MITSKCNGVASADDVCTVEARLDEISDDMVVADRVDERIYG
jgi:hypothetical protein